jgi:Putative MetA-pathway of phenol degradation
VLHLASELTLLAQVPVKAETTTTFEPSSVNHEFGLGDAAIQAYVAHDLNERWAVGAGTRLVARTADDDLGTGKWQIMPGFGVRCSLPEWREDSYFVPVVRYAMSFAGDPTARRISEPQIAPTLNIDLPGPWFITFFPSNDIRINFGQPKSGQTGRLFLPFDALIGAKFTNTLQISLEGSVPIVKEYPVYNFKTELRVRVLF